MMARFACYAISFYTRASCAPSFINTRALERAITLKFAVYNTSANSIYKMHVTCVVPLFVSRSITIYLWTISQLPLTISMDG